MYAKQFERCENLIVPPWFWKSNELLFYLTIYLIIVMIDPYYRFVSILRNDSLPKSA